MLEGGDDGVAVHLAQEVGVDAVDDRGEQHLRALGGVSAPSPPMPLTFSYLMVPHSARRSRNSSKEIVSASLPASLGR